MTEILVNGLVSLGAAFFGAWFAYRFNLKQQKKWDKERQEEEKEEKRAEQILQLNYLQTYLYATIDDLFDIAQQLDSKKDLYERIISHNYEITQLDIDIINTIFVDFSSRFKSNWDALYFTSNEPDFMYSLGRAETALQHFISGHTFEVQNSWNRVKSFREALNNNKNKKDTIKQFIDIGRDNNKSEIFRMQKAVACLDIMINVLNKYANKHKIELKSISYDSDTKKFVKDCLNKTPKTYYLKKIPNKDLRYYDDIKNK